MCAWVTWMYLFHRKQVEKDLMMPLLFSNRALVPLYLLPCLEIEISNIGLGQDMWTLILLLGGR